MSVFRFLLRLEGRRADDPAVLVSAVPNWTVGETFSLSAGEQLRILAIDTDIDEELIEQGFNAVFTVEPANGDAQEVWRNGFLRPVSSCGGRLRGLAHHPGINVRSEQRAITQGGLISEFDRSNVVFRMTRRAAATRAFLWRRALLLGALAIAAVFLRVGGIDAAPSSPSKEAVVRVYDLRLVGSGTIKFQDPFGQITSHWTLTVPGLRIRLVRQTLPKTYRRIDVFLLFGKAHGTGTATADYEGATAANYNCPAHGTYPFPVVAQVGNAGYATSGISVGDETLDGPPPCVGDGAIDGFGGPLDKQGLRTGRAGLCWEYEPSGGTINFPNHRTRPSRFKPPMDRIVNGLSWAKTFSYSHTDDFGTVTQVSVRLSLIRR